LIMEVNQGNGRPTGRQHALPRTALAA